MSVRKLFVSAALAALVIVAAIFCPIIPDFPTPRMTTFPEQFATSSTTRPTCSRSSRVAVWAMASDSILSTCWISARWSWFIGAFDIRRA